VTTLSDILALLNAAVRAGEEAGDALADHDTTPFARLLLQKVRVGTSQHREARDCLRAAMLEAGKKSETISLEALDKLPR
jgi:hypothetical protein